MSSLRLIITMYYMCTNLETQTFIAKQGVHQEEIKQHLLVHNDSCRKVKNFIRDHLLRPSGERRGWFVNETIKVYLSVIECDTAVSPPSQFCCGSNCSHCNVTDINTMWATKQWNIMCFNLWRYEVRELTCNSYLHGCVQACRLSLSFMLCSVNALL